MDVGETRRDDHADAVAGDGPGGVFTAGARTEVLPRHKDFPAVPGIVEDESGIGGSVAVVTPVAEQVLAEKPLVAGRRLQEAGGYDLVRVHILEGKGHAGRFDDIEFLFHNKVLGSVTTPVTAAAAAVSGLARRVRDSGPWRPSKLRLLVDTQYFPGGILSSFMARQAEHPGCRISKPASSRTRSSHSSAICRRTSQEPGTSQAVIPGALCRPAAMDAKARKSSIRPFVQAPRNT